MRSSQTGDRRLPALLEAAQEPLDLEASTAAGVTATVALSPLAPRCSTAEKVTLLRGRSAVMGAWEREGW